MFCSCQIKVDIPLCQLCRLKSIYSEGGGDGGGEMRKMGDMRKMRSLRGKYIYKPMRAVCIRHLGDEGSFGSSVCRCTLHFPTFPFPTTDNRDCILTISDNFTVHSL